MRYRFMDEVLALDLGEPARIEAAKVFEPGDDAFSGPSGPGRVPASLTLELLAMAGGHLLLEKLGRRRLPMLLKVRECRFGGGARPGEKLLARCELLGLSAERNGQALAEVRGEVVAGRERLTAGTLLYLCVSVPAERLEISVARP